MFSCECRFCCANPNKSLPVIEQVTAYTCAKATAAMASLRVLALACLPLFAVLHADAKTLLGKVKAAGMGVGEGPSVAKKPKYTATVPGFTPPSGDQRMNEFMAVDTSGEFMRHLYIEEGRTVCASATSRNRRPTSESPHSDDVVVVEGMLRGRPETRVHAMFDGFQGRHSAMWLAQNVMNYLNDLRDVNEEEITRQFERMDGDLRAANLPGGSSALIIFVRYEKKPTEARVVGRQIVPEGAKEFTSVAEALGGPLMPVVAMNFRRDPRAAKGIYTIHVASLGNSRCVLKSGRTAIHLSTPHTASSHKERHRVQAAGGVFTTVNGELLLGGVVPMTRAFGSFDFKKGGQGRLQQDLVSAVPDVTTFFAYPGDDIVAGTEGAFAHFRSHAAIAAAIALYPVSPETVLDAAKAMVVNAKRRKVTKNISTFVRHLPESRTRSQKMLEGTSGENGEEDFSIDRTNELTQALQAGFFSFLLYYP
ncbi:protein phosphatase PP2C-hn [Toxoplasma gondii VEG]|uniref:protein-serine/threonine phosphatase n=2 Tax=Toxoplasma gondii TaxID=5811 RepID=V4YXJ8_TOXGV|nr:protein phosphatase PP2C-hn [Toxoplasma gondii VEG]KFG36587.1 protein phosphatase PP2C-hn [Toxoplasma gondii FOU]